MIPSISGIAAPKPPASELRLLFTNRTSTRPGWTEVRMFADTSSRYNFGELDLIRSQVVSALHWTRSSLIKMMSRHPILAASILTTLLASAGLAYAQDKPEPKDAASRNDGNTAGQVTAEDVLRALQRQRPVNEVIPPASRAGKPDPATRRTLRPEGSTIVELAGSISRDGDWWMFQQECAGACAPLKVLPNTQLDMMVGTMEGAGSQIAFIVSGEITVFENENYLLVKYAARGTPTVEPSPTRSPPSSETVPTDASAEDVLVKLQTQQPDQSMMPPESWGIGGSARRPPPADRRALLLDGSPVVNRPGRLVREGSWWTLAFESNRPDAAEPPIRLLPNQVLELMVRTSQSGSIGLIFIVSGEATLHDGENYLMTRSVTRRLDLGNLRK